MRPVPPADLGDCRHGDARLQAVADGMVLGRLSDGDAFQRHVGPSVVAAARARLLQERLAAVRQAAPRHGRSRPIAAVGADRGQRRPSSPGRETMLSTAAGRRPHGGAELLVAGAVEIVGNRPGRVRRASIKEYAADSLHAFIQANIAEGATAKTDGWSGYPGAPGVTHEPHVVGNIAAHIVLPWIHRILANAKTWSLGVHGLRRKHLQAYLDEFVFRFNRRRSPHAAFRALLSTRHLQHADRAGSKGIRHLRNSFPEQPLPTSTSPCYNRTTPFLVTHLSRPAGCGTIRNAQGNTG